MELTGRDTDNQEEAGKILRTSTGDNRVGEVGDCSQLYTLLKPKANAMTQEDLSTTGVGHETGNFGQLGQLPAWKYALTIF